MMHRTGVKSVIFRKLFPWIERIGVHVRAIDLQQSPVLAGSIYWDCSAGL